MIFIYGGLGGQHIQSKMYQQIDMIALSSARKFLEDIDPQFPDLQDEMINVLYEQTKKTKKPGQKSNDKHELKPIDEGGLKSAIGPKNFIGG